MNATTLFKNFLLSVTAMIAATLLLPLFGETSVNPFLLTVSAQTVTAVNAASYSQDKKLAPNSIAAAFAAVVTQNNQSFQATSLPLPTSLGGCSVTVGGQPAGLFFVGPTQVNLLIPANAPAGTNIPIVITQANNVQINGTINIEATAPGLFAANASGTGVAAALTTFDGITYRPVFQVSGGQLVELPIPDAGTTSRPNILVLYGTGIRGAQLSNVNVTIQGVPVTVQYAGPVSGNEGLDQINAIIPPELAGSSNLNIVGTSTPFGPLKVKVTIGSNTSNTLTINIGGSVPSVRPQTISAGQLINGTLTATDQIELDSVQTINGQPNPNFGKTYFFDAYTFKGSPGLNIAVDMRSTQFDAALVLYRIDANDNNRLKFVSADDITGQLANGTINAGKNPLMLVVIPDSSDYIIFATSADREPNAVGSYTIQMRTNVIQPLTYGATNFAGAIANTDLLTSGGLRSNGQNATGTYLDVFSFSGAANDIVRVSATSAAFGPYLVLQQNDGDFIAEDPNSSLLQTATINNQTLPDTQTYIIIVTPLTTNLTGSYTISLSKLNSQSQPENALLQSILQPEPLSFLGRQSLREEMNREEVRREAVSPGRTSAGRVIR